MRICSYISTLLMTGSVTMEKQSYPWQVGVSNSHDMNHGHALQLAPTERPFQCQGRPSTWDQPLNWNDTPTSYGSNWTSHSRNCILSFRRYLNTVAEKQGPDLWNSVKAYFHKQCATVECTKSFTVKVLWYFSRKSFAHWWIPMVHLQPEHP